MHESPIKLIVGLGNPGEQYANTRHNAGCLFLTALASQTGATLKAEKQCQGSTGKTIIAGQAVRLLLPSTYMNLSGQAVLATMNYYKINPGELLIVHDELDLDAGTARLKLAGGHGGNNGLRDIIQKLGRNNFARLRIGIGHPGTGKDVSSYVLKKPNISDQQKINASITEALAVIDCIVTGDFGKAMNHLHTNSE